MISLIIKFAIKTFNKIYLMQQMQQIEGYWQPESAHTSPVSSIRELEEKEPKHESLIEKCMKSLIKQKLSGCLINASRKRRDYQENNQPASYHSFSTASSGIHQYLNGSIKRNRYEAFENVTPTVLHTNQQKHSRHQSTLASINERLTKIADYRNNRHSLLQIRDPEAEEIKKPIGLELRKNLETSFISAIEHSEEESLNNREGQSPANGGTEWKGIGREGVKFPKIRNRNGRSSINGLVSPTTVVKSLLKKSADYNIQPDLWKLLTNELEIRQRMRRNSTSISDMNIVSSKQVKSSLFKPTVPSSSRDNFLKYMADLPPPLNRLLEFVISFFDVKLPAELSALFYSSFLQQIKTVNQRVWSIVAFVFWDLNKDGVINSDDVFAVFREFNNFDEQNVNQSIPFFEPKQPLKQKERARKSGNHESKGHPEIVPGRMNIVNMLKQLKPKEEISNLTKENDNNQIERNSKRSSKYLVLGLQNIQKALEIFKQELSRLNSKLSSNQFEEVNVEELKSPSEVPISFLEEIVLTHPSLKYKETLPLLSAGGGNRGGDDKLEISSKNPQVKVCSSYQQCFISTEHNEETRMAREKIEEYKQELKVIRSRRNNMLESKAKDNLKMVKQMNYVSVARSQMGQTIKEIVFNLLGCLQ